MSKTAREHQTSSRRSQSAYKRTLYGLHVQLVKLQSHVIREDLRLLVLLEGRDAAGKDGAITATARWNIVRTENKHAARINLVKALLASLDFRGKDERLLVVDPQVMFAYGAETVKDRRLAP
jgi:polyphosphate kinase 2 (PPK2 family)